jgi:hypothetical protein
MYQSSIPFGIGIEDLKREVICMFVGLSVAEKRELDRY